MIIGTIAGIVGGIVQDGIGYFKEKKTKEIEHKRDIEMQKIQHEQKIKEHQARLRLSQEQTKQLGIQNEIDFNKYNAEIQAVNAQENMKWLDVVGHNNTKYLPTFNKEGKLYGILNLFITLGNLLKFTAQPMITYLVGFALFWILVHKSSYDTETIKGLVYILSEQFAAMISYWFYRKSSDKLIFNPENTKKKT